MTPETKARAMIHELNDIILTTPLPQFGLAPGDIGTVVLVHQEGAGYEGSNPTKGRKVA